MGVACLERRTGEVRLLFAGVIHAPKGRDLFDRLGVLSKELKSRIETLNPDEVAVEDTFFAKNARSAFHLGMARGVAVAACLGRGIKIYEYTPATVKSVVTGYGRADKAQVQKMVRLRVGLASNTPLEYDATDAIAVAICHAFSVRPLAVRST